MDLSQVTLTQMRYAVAIEDTGSFRLAATQCHVSQSGLSMQLQKLEDLLGQVLFDRSKKPVLVTEAGRPALAQMRAVLRETERLGQIVAEGDVPSGRYRLGVIPTLSPTVIPLFLGPFTRTYPRVKLVVEELKTSEIIAQLQADTLDAGGQTVQMTALDAAAVKQHAARVGEMPVHAVMLWVFHLVRHFDLVLDQLVGLAFDHRVAAELAGENNERAIQQAARFEVKHELRDRRVNLLLHSDQARVAIFVRVPIEERNVFSGDLDKAGADFRQPARQQETRPHLPPARCYPL